MKKTMVMRVLISIVRMMVLMILIVTLTTTIILIAVMLGMSGGCFFVWAICSMAGKASNNVKQR